MTWLKRMSMTNTGRPFYFRLHSLHRKRTIENYRLCRECREWRRGSLSQWTTRSKKGRLTRHCSGAGEDKLNPLCACLGEQDGEHVLPLEADGQVDQREAHVEGRGPAEELHLVGGELPGDVPAGRLVGFDGGQVSLHHACGRAEKRGSEGRRDRHGRCCG